MRLCVLEVGPMPEPARPIFSSYPVMIRNWLSPALPEAEFDSVSLINDESLPEPDAYDGYIITGSRFSVNDNLPWIAPLRDFIRTLAERSIPVFGICFGHQIIAQAFGGEVNRSHTGWALGSQEYTYPEESVHSDEPAFVFHQDQVETMPTGATLIGSSEQCPIGALKYDHPALSVQYHPEFVTDYMNMLIDLKEDSLPADRTGGARDSVANLPVDNSGTAHWAAEFFRNTVRLPA